MVELTWLAAIALCLLAILACGQAPAASDGATAMPTHTATATASAARIPAYTPTASTILVKDLQAATPTAIPSGNAAEISSGIETPSAESASAVALPTRTPSPTPIPVTMIGVAPTWTPTVAATAAPTSAIELNPTVTSARTPTPTPVNVQTLAAAKTAVPLASPTSTATPSRRAAASATRYTTDSHGQG